MQRYRFCNDTYKLIDEETVIVEKKTEILYKCLICNNFTKEWDDTWSNEKKTEVKAEVDAHHNIHIVDQTIDSSGN